MIQNYLSDNKFEKLKPKAILFDMDGVLFDSLPSHSEAWVRAMAEHNLPMTAHDVYLSEGQPAIKTISIVYKEVHGQEADKEKLEEIYGLKSRYFEAMDETQPIAFAFEFTQLLKSKGYQLYIVTGSAQRTLIDNVQKYFPDTFNEENIISAFDVKRGKPYPDPYLEALRRAGVEPWEAIVVENAPLGVKSSSAAQVFTIAVNTGPLDAKLLLDNGANIVFDSMEELYNEWNSIEKTIKNK